MNTPLTDNIKATIAKIRADHEVELGKLRAALRECEGENAKLRDEGAEMRAKLLVCEQTNARLELAAPVVLTLFAFLGDEADRAGLVEIVEWLHRMDDDQLSVWLDAERRNTKRMIDFAEAKAKESSGG